MTAFKPVRFGKYILLDKVATGGMAELYRAKITGVKGFEKLIAIKKILPHLTSENALVSSFIDEAKLAALFAPEHGLRGSAESDGKHHRYRKQPSLPGDVVVHHG